jgi:hypothetical protein
MDICKGIRDNQNVQTFIAQTVAANSRALTTRPQIVSAAPPREEVNKLFMSTVSHDLPMMGHNPNAVVNFTATFAAQNDAERLRRSQSTQEKVMSDDPASRRSSPAKRSPSSVCCKSPTWSLSFDTSLATIFLMCSS